MQTIAVMSQKGGSGKTTLAVNLLSLLEGRKIGFDVDPQRSFSSWAGLREPRQPVAACSSMDLERHLVDADQQGMEWAVVDTAPHAEAGAGLVARYANLSIVPVIPSVFDLMATGGIVDILRAADCPAVFVLNKCTARTAEIEQAMNWLQEKYPAVPVADVFLFNRIIYSRAALSGCGVCEYEPNGTAANEVRRLWENLKGFMQ
jgi:chromosome partitioning protein